MQRRGTGRVVHGRTLCLRPPPARPVDANDTALPLSLLLVSRLAAPAMCHARRSTGGELARWSAEAPGRATRARQIGPGSGLSMHEELKAPREQRSTARNESSSRFSLMPAAPPSPVNSPDSAGLLHAHQTLSSGVADVVSASSAARPCSCHAPLPRPGRCFRPASGAGGWSCRCPPRPRPSRSPGRSRRSCRRHGCPRCRRR